MADSADILNVRDLLPAESSDEGWNDSKVETYLDADKTVFEVVQAYWESRAAQLYTAMDINESGSSRSLGNLYQNAKNMAEYWRDRVKAVADEVAEEEKNRSTTLNTITRV